MSDEKYEGLPEDLTSVSSDELSNLLQSTKSKADALSDDEESDVPELLKAADAYEAVKAEVGRRDQEAAANAAAREEIKNRLKTLDEVAEESVDDAGEAVSEEQGEPALVAGGAVTTPRNEARRKLNPSLEDIAKRAPKVKAPSRQEAVLVASSDIAGFTQGGKIDGMQELTRAMHNRARTLSDGRGAKNYVPVASLQREHKFMLSPQLDVNEIDRVLKAAADPDILIAAGGWCAPSEISYDFFNIVCEDGMLDLPTVGVNRGGISWPTSPSFGDLVGDTALWSWTEAQDIAAVTGTGGGTKTCGIVPCVDFNEARLQCDGLCLTVGNLMDYAYPELIANHTRLLFAAHAHKMNQLRIASLVNQSVDVGDFAGVGAANPGVVSSVLGALELQAIDYREKFAMCEDAVLEVVLPRWLRGAMRSDLTKRTGIDLISVADATLMSYFDALNVRIQWVNDWQVRAAGLPGFSTPLLEWPETVDFLLFAPGTFVLGQGLQLNLGVIRDSTLNETNDFTAEWMEECWLIAMLGHESRFGTINICTNGKTGIANYEACTI